MKRTFTQTLLMIALLLCTAMGASAQATIKGQVVDAETNEPLIGAGVIVEGSTHGQATDNYGFFSLSVPTNSTINISYVGYKDYFQVIAAAGSVDLGVIRLEPDAVTLQDVTVTSSLAVTRKTPVAASVIESVYIEERLGTLEFPEILKSTPGVYATKAGGGYGDSEINMRGFTAANVAVLVNGIPMNDMEWGGLYWSNWQGLTDVTKTIQTQRGLGASKVSAPSVGGTINIVTKTIDAEKGGSVSYQIKNAGQHKTVVNVSTGLMDNGWALTLLGSRAWGRGYIQGTEYEAYTYFGSIAKRINNNHQISFTAFGAPQWHNQRSNTDNLTIENWQKVEKYTGPGRQYRYNPTYGFDKNGQRKTSNFNKFHKPQLSLNHIWEIDHTSSMSTALYLSLGNGYGYSGQGNSTYRNQWRGTNYGELNTYFRNEDGTFAYDQIQEMNEQSTEGSLMVMSRSVNKHVWYGLLSTYTKKLSDKFDLYAGVDGRYYKGVHTNDIVDLYNGDYYIDSNRASVRVDNNAAAADPSWVNQKLGVGDIVYRDWDGYVAQGGLFSQLEYSDGRISAFVSGAANFVSQWRYDRLYYDKAHAKSAKVNVFSGNVKGGLNYNIDKFNNVYANTGYISRAPFFSGGAFLSSAVSNAVNKDAVNEKIFSVELGYGFKSAVFSANVNVYHTKWMDKTMASSSDKTFSDGTSERITINMQGVDAIHQGVEVELFFRPTSWLNLTGMFSIGNWRWNSNPIGYYYNSVGQPVNSQYQPASGIQEDDHLSSQLLLKDLKVGGSAQTTAAFGANFQITKDIRVGADWNFFGRNYARWSPVINDMQEGAATEYKPAWRIPSYNVFDLSASYTFQMGSLRARLSGNINNIFDQEYIQYADNGSEGNWQTARVFYGFGRTTSMTLKIFF